MAISFALSLVFSKASASSVSFCQPDIPAVLWEQHNEGAAMAITLTKGLNANQHPTSLLRVYIRNTSSAAISYGQNDDDLGIKFFYVNADGVKVSLHDYDAQEKRDSEERQRTVQDTTIASRKTICVTLDNLTSEEITLLSSHPVFCTFSFNYPPNNHTITSAPKML